MVAIVSSYPGAKDVAPTIVSTATLEEAEHSNLHRAHYAQVLAVQDFLGTSGQYTASGVWTRGTRTITALVNDLAESKIDSDGGSGTGLTLVSATLNDPLVNGATLNSLLIDNGLGTVTGDVSATSFELTSTRSLQMNAPSWQLSSDAGVRLSADTTSMYLQDVSDTNNEVEVFRVTNAGQVSAEGASFAAQVTVGADAATSRQVVSKAQFDAGLTTTLASAAASASTAITTANDAQVRVKNNTAAPVAGKIKAGTWVGVTDANGRATISFGESFSSVFGVVLTWGDAVNLPNTGYNTAPAPYVYTLGSSSVTWAGGAGSVQVRVNWVAYGV